MARKEHDLTELDDAALLAKANELAAVAETMRAKDADGADRAADAAQQLRNFVAGRRLAATETANYARAHEQQTDTEE